MVAPITVKIDGSTEGLTQALSAANKSISVFGHNVGVELPGKLGLAVNATKAVAKVTKTVASAAKDAAAEEQIFNDAMAAATGMSSDYNKALEDTIAASQKKAFTDTETRKALASLTTATGDAASGAANLAVAQDVARLTGVDLETASDAVAKALAGQDTALVRLIPGLEKGATAQETIANAAELAAGASDTYASSAEAMGAKVKIAFGEAAEAAGQALGPALQQLGAALKPLLADFLTLVSKLLPPVITLFSALVKVASLVVSAINKIVDAIQRLIGKIRELLGPLTDAVNKLREIDLNPFNAPATAAAATTQMTRVGALGVEEQANRTGRGGVTVNIYGDPSVIEARVTRALRGYTRRNGASSVFTPERT